MKLVIVDLGCGNVGSVRLALGRFGVDAAPTPALPCSASTSSGCAAR
jgi:imidazoleglycerol phosphate synthase glutamine amidotransferase subunit HisH